MFGSVAAVVVSIGPRRLDRLAIPGRRMIRPMVESVLKTRVSQRIEQGTMMSKEPQAAPVQLIVISSVSAIETLAEE